MNWNSMQRNNKSTALPLIFLFTFILGCLISCKEKVKPIPFEIIEFDKQILQSSNPFSDSTRLIEFKKEHSGFFPIWYNQIMEMNKVAAENDAAGAAELIHSFSKYYGSAYKIVEQHFSKNKLWKNEFEQAFAYWKQFVPNSKKPTIVQYFSGFSATTTCAVPYDTAIILGYSAEMFLNDTCQLYKQLTGLPDFFSRFNKTESISFLLFQQYLKAEFHKQEDDKNMLDRMIFWGKIWYTTIACFPEIEPAQIFGYDAKEWKYLRLYEKDFWQHYLNKKLLYNTNRNNYHRYFVEGKHTFGVEDNECPPMIGKYTGLKIVEQYMKKTGKNIQELWKTISSKEILQLSNYNPLNN